MSQRVTSRIAPTPSGLLHLGNAFNFLLTALLVDFQDGQLHLRIDDLDGPRVDAASVEDIFVQLEWLGIDYDSGPSGPEELFKQYSQQTQMDAIRMLFKVSANPEPCMPANVPVQKSDNFQKAEIILEPAA